MAGILQLSCDHCTFLIQYTDHESHMLWRGKSYLLPHPCESLYIKKITGFDSTEAKYQGAIYYYKIFKICLECGEGEHYRPNEIKCLSCKSEKLCEPRNIGPGCIASLCQVGKTKYWHQPCPKCSSGNLSIKAIGIS